MTFSNNTKNPCRLYVVRHVVTEWNKLGKIQGHTDIDLSPEGVQQAHHLAKKFKDIHFSVVHASDLLRAKHTAQIIAQSFGLPVLDSPDLRERNWGNWEGRNIDELRQLYGKEMEEFVENPEQKEPVQMPGIAIVETYSQALRRVVPYLLKIAKDYRGENVLVVTHGGILRGLMQFFGHTNMPRHTIQNGYYLILESDGNSLHLCHDPATSL